MNPDKAWISPSRLAQGPPRNVTGSARSEQASKLDWIQWSRGSVVVDSARILTQFQRNLVIAQALPDPSRLLWTENTVYIEHDFM